MVNFLHKLSVSVVLLGLGLGPAIAGDGKTDLPCPLAQNQEQSTATNLAVLITPTADLPCAAGGSSPAFSLGAFGGTEGDGNGGITAQMLLPLNENFFLQTDGVIGLQNEGVFGDVAGHAFMRNDAVQLGAYGNWSSGNGMDETVQLGAEAEADLGGLTLSAVGGWQSTGQDNVFLDTRLGFGLTDQTQIYVGYAYDDGSIAKAGFDHTIDFSSGGAAHGVTLFGQAQLANSSDVSALLGVKLNFGGSSLSNCPLPNATPKMASFWAVAKKHTNRGSSAGSGPAAQQCSTLSPGILAGLCESGCSCGGWTGTYTGVDYSGCGATSIACSSPPP